MPKYFVEYRNGVKYTKEGNSPTEVIKLYIKNGKLGVRRTSKSDYHIKTTMIDGKTKSVNYYKLYKLDSEPKRITLRDLLNNFSYKLSDNGVLQIFTPDGLLLIEAQNCGNMSKQELQEEAYSIIQSTHYFREYAKDTMNK